MKYLLLQTKCTFKIPKPKRKIIIITICRSKSVYREDGLTKYIQQRATWFGGNLCPKQAGCQSTQPTLPISQNTVGSHRSEKIVILENMSVSWNEARNFFPIIFSQIVHSSWSSGVLVIMIAAMEVNDDAFCF